MPPVPDLKRPLRTAMGLNDERTNAGYKPATIPINTAKLKISKMRIGLMKYANDNSLPVILFSNGRNNFAKKAPNTMLIKLNKIDSHKNCQIMEFLFEPNVLRTPISLALSTEIAVDKLIKLIQARNRINKPIVAAR